MTRQQRIDITNRLDTYLGYSAEESYAIIREVSHALGLAYDDDIIIQTSSELEQSEERAYDRGYQTGNRVGYMHALDEIELNPMIMDEGSEAVVRVEINKLRANYLDRY